MQVQECRTINNAIVTLQKKLLGNSDLVLGRRGNANYTNPADFVRLIHQNLTEKADIELKALLPSCSVPSLLRITVLHTAGREARQGELGLLVVGVRATMVEETWTWSCTSLHCPERQSFLLRSEVEWVEVPEVWADKNTSRCKIISFCTSKDPYLAVILMLYVCLRFWLRQAALSCEGDICWRHLLRPLPGDLPPEQTAKV